MKIVQVNFGTFKEYDVNNRFFNPNLVGGALLDIGVYAVGFEPLVYDKQTWYRINNYDTI